MNKGLDEFLNRLLNAIQDTLGKNLISVVLYGSFARGEATSDSDMDIFIVCEELPKSQWDRLTMFNKIEEKLKIGDWKQELMPVIKTKKEAEYHSPLYLDMVYDGKILFDRDGFFQNILLEMKERMEKLGSKKVYLDDKTYYWDLKPDYKFGEKIDI